jgi:dTDP-4-amino-4,6-dideoxygalactose transaminase
MIVTNRDDIAEKIRLLRSHGMTTFTLDRYEGHAFTYDVVEYGFNYRSSEINAAIGRVQLAKLNEKNRKRKEITRSYIKRISQIDGVSSLFQNLDKNRKPAYHIFPVLLDEGIDRKTVMQSMKNRGVQTSIHYRPVHTFTAYGSLQADNKLPITNKLKDRILTLPLFPAMTEKMIDFVTESLRLSLC